MKKRKILVLIPMVGLFLSGCSFSEGFAKAKHWVADKIYHPAKDWIDEKTGKKEEKKDDEKPTPAPSGDVAVTGVTVTPATLDLTTESADTTLTATVAPSNATNKSVTWSVAPEGVVTVSETGVVHVVAAGDAVVTATSKADTTKTGTCNVKVSDTAPASGDGTAEHPYSPAEFWEVYGSLEANTWSESRVYLKGQVAKLASEQYTINVDETNSIIVYKPTMAEGVQNPGVGDVIVAEGFVENYNGKIELTSYYQDAVEAHRVAPTIQQIVTRGQNSVTIDSASSEHATVTLSQTSADNGTTITFTVAPETGYSVTAVTLNGAPIEATEGTYSFVLRDAAVVKVEAVQEGVIVPYTLAFGSNGWMSGSNTGYNVVYDVSTGGKDWKIPGNQNLNYGLKLGGKLSAETTRSIVSQSKFDAEITSVAIVTGSKDSAITVTGCSITIFSTMEDAAAGTGAVETIAGTFVDSGTFSFEKPSTSNWTDVYFALNFSMTSTAASSNKGIVITSFTVNLAGQQTA